MKRLSTFALDRGGLLALATLALYLWVAPAHVVHGDNAEFSALGALGGVAHPSGYPLYVLWLRAWSWLPVNPAHAAAIATVILTGLEVLVLHAACRAWGARRLGATAAVGLLVAGPIVLRVQSEAEVFALNAVIAGLVVWLSARAAPLRGLRRAAALGLIAGLGMSNHMTCVLVAPVGILGVVRAGRELVAERSTSTSQSVAATLAVALGALVVGLAPYGYLLVASDGWVSWGQIDDLGALVRHILREDYGGAGAFSPRGTEVAASASVAAWLASVGRAYLWLPAIAGGAMLGYLAVRGDGTTARGDGGDGRARLESRLAWASLGVSVVLAGPVLCTRFDIAPSGLGLYIVQRFHLLGLTLLVIPVAVAVDRGAAVVMPLASARLRAARGLHGVLVVVGFVAAAAPSLGFVARMHSPAVEQGLINLLTTLPPDAIVIGSTDDFHYGLGYLQGARGMRRDVATITTPQLGLRHYRERVRARAGFWIENVAPGSATSLNVRVAEQALATGRPVFIDPFQATIAASLPTYPYGLVFRVLPRGVVPPRIDEVFAINRELFERYTFGYAVPGVDDQLAAQVHVHYARVWRMLADGLAQAGLGPQAELAAELAKELAPR